MAEPIKEQRGLFIVLDGVDGCGKSTQAELLCRSLGEGCEPGAQPLHLREPGSTELGERVRALLLDRGLDLGAEVETLLFAAARRQMLDELVAPALAGGRDVVCERFHPSTFAYQAVAGGLDPEEVLGLLLTWANTPSPDLIVLLSTEVDLATARRGQATDRIEDKGVEFQRRVAEGYRIYAERDERVRTVDGARPIEEVAADVVAAVEAVRGSVAP